MNGGWGKNVIIFCVGNSLSTYTYNRGDSEGPTDRSDDTTAS